MTMVAVILIFHLINRLKFMHATQNIQLILPHRRGKVYFTVTQTQNKFLFRVCKIKKQTYSKKSEVVK